MQQNPFAPYSPAPPEAFVNRYRELDLIFGHIRAAQRGNVAISGPLGSGKTSLLRHVANPQVAEERGVEPPEYALIYLDIQSVAPFSAARFWHRVAQLLGRTPNLELEDAVERLRSTAVPDIVELEEFLDALADNSTTLVLLLDEFEWALQVNTPEEEAESRNFLAQLASLARRTPRVLCLMVATSAPLPEVTREIESWRGSPFPTIFVATSLRPLERRESERLVDLALGERESVLSEEERSLLFASTGGQPAALQAAAFSLHQGIENGLANEQLCETARAAASEALAALAPVRAVDQPRPTETPRVVGAPEGQTGLWIDTQTGDVFVEGRRVESLTALEYNLLRLLYAHAGRLCSKEEIIQQVWGTEFVGQIDDSRVEKLISRLRRKVEPVPGRPQFIRTVRGRGYRFVP